MRMHRSRLVCCIVGLAFALGALATYPLSVAVASTAAGITLESAPQQTIVFDIHDQPVFTFFREQRTDTGLDGVSASMNAAVIAIEDRHFYSHHGIDFVRVLGA